MRIARTVIRKTGFGNELVVRAYSENGLRMVDADYYTDDKEDAEQTAREMTRAHREHEAGGDTQAVRLG